MPNATDNGDGPSASDRYALKENAQFLVADKLGDISASGDGLFRDDTRVLSRLTLQIGSRAPSLLRSGVSHDNVLFRAHLTNRQLPDLGDRMTPEGVIHIERTRLLWNGCLHEQITLTNYGASSTPAPTCFAFAADFADIFEVRGLPRAERGQMLKPEIGADFVRLHYLGLDGQQRSCAIAFSVRPDRLTADAAEFQLVLAPHQQLSLYLVIAPERSGVPTRALFRAAAAKARIAMRAKRRRGAVFESSGDPFRLWLGKARADLALLTDELPTGPYPCAGIPWFSTPFGRDGLITALQTLWCDPDLARGVLLFLAENQAHEYSAFQDSSPGKILHEVRNSEMALRGEVPFRRYYGGVDSTPLFVLLAGAYAQRTGDMAFMDRIEPAVQAALAWIDGDGDSNRDGLVDYQRARDSGLANQGWKDSVDSVFHADGSIPPGPIALVEVQGYVYAAWRAMAWLARHRRDYRTAVGHQRRANGLRRAVEQQFWIPDARYYAIAVDGDGRQCQVRASNAGQLLYSQLPSSRRAALVTEQLLSASFHDGWGIRTLARDQPRFNPMSYHNGSIWPHDTALCAAGIAQYGNRRAAASLLSEMFAAARYFGGRLPELFCGFGRRPGEPPVGYPVACLPQAWSSGAVFMLLQACLGISIDAAERTIHIDRPELPPELERLPVRGLVVGDERVDLVFERTSGRVSATPLSQVSETIRILVRA
jgi:glycogen debranching enzyme